MQTEAILTISLFDVEDYHVEPSYPGYGSTCNGCGVCCIAETCGIGKAFFGEEGICPALVKVKSGYSCQLMIDPTKDLKSADTESIKRFAPPVGAEFPEIWAEHIKFMMGAGLGCDSEGPEDD